MRKEGYLHKLKSHQYPRHLLFYDTETFIIDLDKKRKKYPLRLGIAIYVRLDKDLKVQKRTVHKFYSTDDFIDIINKYNHKKQTLYIFCHNQSFDVRVLNLPAKFNELNYENEPPIRNQRTFIWTIKTNKGKLLFIDTANYAVSTVEALGEQLGYEKMKVDFNNSSDDELFVYCERDVEIIERFILSFIDFLFEHELGSFKATLASQALTSYKTKFMIKHPYTHTNENGLELERKAYHGGRTEAFRIGELNTLTYYKLDVNSMYPYAMHNHYMPIKFIFYGENPDMNYLPYALDKYYVIADVTLRTNEPVYPKYQKNKLIFPIGEFRTCLHHKELEYALQHKHIQQIHSTSIYTKEIIFNEYVDFFYQLKNQYKEQANNIWFWICKIFLNSLYGKFGQLQPNRLLLYDTDIKDVSRLKTTNINEIDEWLELLISSDIRLTDYDLASGTISTYINWYGEIYKEWREGETSNSCPAIAGCVTANSRMLLWEYMKQAGLGNVLYIDTDSLIVNPIGFANLQDKIDKTKLGYLKIEDQTNHLVIYGAKDYIFNEKQVIKGINKNSIQLDQNTWEVLQFDSFISFINAGANTEPISTTRIKQRISAYDKGKVLEDGTVKPLALGS